MTQELMVLEKDKRGKITSHDVLPVSFVPLTGSGAGNQQSEDDAG
jgi:protein-L-isoaspartate O-methyltransferase